MLSTNRDIFCQGFWQILKAKLKGENKTKYRAKNYSCTKMSFSNFILVIPRTWSSRSHDTFHPSTAFHISTCNMCKFISMKTEFLYLIHQVSVEKEKRLKALFNAGRNHIMSLITSSARLCPRTPKERIKDWLKDMNLSVMRHHCHSSIKGLLCTKTVIQTNGKFSKKDEVEENHVCLLVLLYVNFF